MSFWTCLSDMSMCVVGPCFCPSKSHVDTCGGGCSFKMPDSPYPVFWRMTFTALKAIDQRTDWPTGGGLLIRLRSFCWVQRTRVTSPFSPLFSRARRDGESSCALAARRGSAFPAGPSGFAVLPRNKTIARRSFLAPAKSTPWPGEQPHSSRWAGCPARNRAERRKT
jgi:hypothetical protein